MKATQKQRDFITSLVNQIGVEEAYRGGALTINQAIDQGVRGGFRTPREVARHSNTMRLASDTISKLLELKNAA